MRIRLLAAMAAIVAFSGTATAQAEKPTVEVRLQSVNVLLDKGEYIAGLVGQEEAVKQVREIVKQLSADGKGLEGVDPKKPFGLTATLTADVVNSSFVAMVPIADEKRFIQLLQDRAQIFPEKKDDGTYTAAVPAIEQVHMRFANGYVYVGRTAADVGAKAIPTPKAFFANDNGAVGSAIVHIDRIPAELKQFVLAQMEQAIAEQREQQGIDTNPAQKLGFDLVTENFAAALKSFLEDSKELTLRVDIDEKSDEMSAELTLTAKPSTAMARNLKSLAGKTSLPAGIVSAENSVGRLTVKAAIPEAAAKDLGKLLDLGIKDLMKEVPDDYKADVERVLNTIAAVAKAGELDLAVALKGPNSKGKHTIIGAVGVPNGKEIEKLVKDMHDKYGVFIGDDVTVKFDVAKVGDFNLHTVTLTDVPPEMEQIFGGKTIWLATSAKCIAFSVEADGEALKAGLKAKAAEAPVLAVDVSFAKLLPLVAADMPEDQRKKIIADVFGAGPVGDKDKLSITITGGDKLSVKGKLKGAGVRLMFNLFSPAQID